MPDSAGERRLCPTRADGAQTLIEHVITPGVCRDRQRRLYHKCHACVHQGDALAARELRPGGLAEVPKAPPARIAPALTPAARATPRPVRRVS